MTLPEQQNAWIWPHFAFQTVLPCAAYLKISCAIKGLANAKWPSHPVFISTHLTNEFYFPSKDIKHFTIQTLINWFKRTYLFIYFPSWTSKKKCIQMERLMIKNSTVTSFQCANVNFSEICFFSQKNWFSPSNRIIVIIS